MEAFPGSKVELVGGTGGVFEVTMGDTLVYEKDRSICNRFPDEGEIVKLVRGMI